MNEADQIALGKIEAASTTKEGTDIAFDHFIGEVKAVAGDKEATLAVCERALAAKDAVHAAIVAGISL